MTNRGSSIVFVVGPLLTMPAGMVITLAESSRDTTASLLMAP